MYVCACVSREEGRRDVCVCVNSYVHLCMSMYVCTYACVCLAHVCVLVHVRTHPCM